MKKEKSHKLLCNLKSQGLSLNTIIIAAIVLIVLVVLWSIFTGKIGGFSKELKECRGTCTTSSCAAVDTNGNDYCYEGQFKKEGDYVSTPSPTGLVKGNSDPVCCILENA